MDIQQAFDNLRVEIQTDRIATHTLITEGFDKMGTKMDNYEQRISAVEAKQKTMIGTVVAIGTASVSTFIAWLFGK